MSWPDVKLIPQTNKLSKLTVLKKNLIFGTRLEETLNNTLSYYLSETEKCVILSSWKNLIEDTIKSEALLEGVLEETIPVWIGMRVRQVVNVYMFSLKESGSSTAGRKGEPAMRKTLDKFLLNICNEA